MSRVAYSSVAPSTVRADALRKGWCPGALRPMAALDGWLVRLRLSGGMLPVAVASAVAGLAERDGNGLFDLSSRANLQMRGIAEARLPALVEDLRILGLVDDDAAAESVRNVIASPLAGLQRGIDIRPLVRALEAALTKNGDLHALPGKFGFLVDDGMRPSLADVAADVRFDWIAGDEVFAIGLGGTRSEASRIGFCAAGDLVGRATDIARGALDLFRRDGRARRLRGLIDLFGAPAVAVACGGRFEGRGPDLALETKVPAGVHRFDGRPVLGLAASFGRLDADMLRVASKLAGAHGCRELRLTPWRAILLPGVVPDGSEVAGLEARGFILDPNDPRLRLVACVGREGCASGSTSTHADATRLADLVEHGGGPLHVSGCVKGCARACVAPLTLVARDGRYDLVRNGRAGDPPIARDLDIEAVRAYLTAARRDAGTP